MKSTVLTLAMAALLGLGVWVLRTPRNKARDSESAANAPETPVPEKKPPALKPDEHSIQPVDIQQLLLEIAAAIRNGDQKALSRLLDDLKDLAVPPPVPDEENAALVYQKAFDLMKEVETTYEEEDVFAKAHKGEPLTQEEEKTLGAWLKKNAEALALLRAAAEKPQCRFPLEYEEGFAMLVPHVSHMMRAARMLMLEGGEDSEWTSLAMGRAVRQDPLLVSKLVGGFVDTLGLEGLDEIPEGKLANFLDAWDPSTLRGGMPSVLLMQVYAAVRFFEQVSSEGVPESQGLDWWKEPIRAQDIANYVETMAELSEIAGRPYAEARRDYETFQQVRINNAPWFSEALQHLMPPYDQVLKMMTVHEARLSMAKVALELDRYHRQHGAYPATLDPIEGLPEDPFTGSGFTYRLDGVGFVLESPEGEVECRRR